MLSIRAPARSWPALGLLTIVTVLAADLGACGKSYPSLRGMNADSAFTAVILPVLEDQCQGCHLPGGPVYHDLPFDDPRLVAERGEELLLQLEGEGKARLMEWLALVRDQGGPGAGP